MADSTDLYIHLSYEDYKKFEDAITNADLEKTAGAGVYYHNYFRLPLGGVTLEVHGPVVKAGRSDDE